MNDHGGVLLVSSLHWRDTRRTQPCPAASGFLLVAPVALVPWQGVGVRRQLREPSSASAALSCSEQRSRRAGGQAKCNALVRNARAATDA
eukprot:COSAG06_NODE_36786_length_443_cov_0.363372_1_plen_89_part_10